MKINLVAHRQPNSPTMLNLDRPIQLIPQRFKQLGLAWALDMLRAGDTLVVWKLDSPVRGRLAIDLAGYLVGDLAARDVHFRGLTDSILFAETLGDRYQHAFGAVLFSCDGKFGGDGAGVGD